MQEKNYFHILYGRDIEQNKNNNENLSLDIIGLLDQNETLPFFEGLHFYMEIFSSVNVEEPTQIRANKKQGNIQDNLTYLYQ